MSHNFVQESEVTSEVNKPMVEVSSSAHQVQLTEPPLALAPCYPLHHHNQPTVVAVMPPNELAMLPSGIDSSHMVTHSSPAALVKPLVHGTGWMSNHAIDQPYATWPVLSSASAPTDEPTFSSVVSNSLATSVTESTGVLNHATGIAAGLTNEIASRTSTVSSHMFPSSATATGSISSTESPAALPLRQPVINNKPYKSQQTRVTTTPTPSTRTSMTQSVRSPTVGNDRFQKTSSRFNDSSVGYLNGR